MAEKVLNSPLTGEEVILAIGDRVMESLRRDCFLNPHTSYDFYEAKIQMAIKMNDAGMRDVEVNQEVKDAMGEEPDNYELAEVILNITPKPPNEERVATGQGVPVMGKDENGRPEVKHIKYARSRATTQHPAKKAVVTKGS